MTHTVQNERKLLLNSVESLTTEKDQLTDQTDELRRQAEEEISGLRVTFVVLIVY